MQNKAQLFSVDVVISVILVVLAIGIISAAAEFNFYNSKQQNSYETLKQKAETAAIVLTNSNWSSCNVGNTNLAYSINKKRIAAVNSNPDARKTEIKKRLGLEDYNAKITLDTTPQFEILTDEINTPTAVSLEFNIFYCDDAVTPAALINCMENECLQKRKLTIVVGK